MLCITSSWYQSMVLLLHISICTPEGLVVAYCSPMAFSSFVFFINDETAGDYIDRILYQLMLAIEAQIPLGRWYIIGRPSSSPNPATSPTTTTLRTTCLLVASLSLLATFFR
ncbi:hypothetical protein M5K25_022669 [Dendrobium thyrsiflorum]|uniref:Uncharacterized protein n=1 Tax=Dendrobium thyrsiflorum TaxID=117978 RepID=A0ABD0U6I7_DENTH